MSKSDRIPVSAEVLETMLEAVEGVRDGLHGSFPDDPWEQGRLLEQLATKLLDVKIALEALCRPQI